MSLWIFGVVGAAAAAGLLIALLAGVAGPVPRLGRILILALLVSAPVALLTAAAVRVHAEPAHRVDLPPAESGSMALPDGYHHHGGSDDQ